ncbi:phosphoribosylglycinamide formyltransferase [Roseobacteraceae bacterium S113]
MTLRTAIFISGGGSNMVRLVESMDAAHPARAALVLSNVASAGGLAKAQALGVATEVVDHKPFGADRESFEAAVQEVLVAHEIDIVCLAGFMRVLTESFVAHWQGRMLNIHPSLLPKYRGLNTHARAIEAGDSEAGCTVHMVTPELDEGPILGQSRVPILADDTPDSLAARVLREEHKLYPQCLLAFCVAQAAG